MRELAADYLTNHAERNKRASSVRDDRAILTNAILPALALLASMKESAAPGVRFVFPGDAADRPLQDVRKTWKAACAAAGLEGVRLHDLRHTYASHLVSSGLSLEIVGRLLGHTQVATTRRYAHLADSPLREATERFGAMVGSRATAAVAPLADARKR